MSDSSPGLLLSSMQVHQLISGAQKDGLLTPKRKKKKSSLPKRSAAPNRAYEDLLISLLLCGNATYTGPTHTFPQEELLALQQNGLLQLKETDHSASLRKSLSHEYVTAFRAFRALESNLFTSPIISLDTINSISHREQTKESLKADELLGEAHHSIDILIRQVNPILESLATIFGHHFYNNIEIFFDILTKIHRPLSGSTPAAERIKTAYPLHIGNILQLMELEIRSIEHLERELPIGNYSPDELISLWETDALYTGLDNDFAKYATIAMDLAVKPDPEAFFFVHAFWRTFFELLNLLRESEHSGHQLFLPSSVNIPLHEQRSSTANTTQELVGIYRLYLGERTEAPQLQSVHDLFRLREDKRIFPLRQTLKAWQAAAQTSDAPLMTTIKNEINAAQKELRRIAGIQRAGQFVTYLALPSAMIDKLRATSLGQQLSPVGPTTDAWIKMKMEHFSWLAFGT